jgi:hypothetical protein
MVALELRDIFDWVESSDDFRGNGKSVMLLSRIGNLVIAGASPFAVRQFRV